MDFTSAFTIDRTIRGHHICTEIWMPIIGEGLAHAIEGNYDYDPYTVAITKVGTIIQHRISATCNLFLEQGGTILCTVSGPRLCARDLPKGGLDVPCKLSF